MKILGIDWGEAKIGLALANGPLAEPWKVIRYQDDKELLEDLKKIIQEQGIEEVVVGISEGLSGQKAQEFGNGLRQVLEIKVNFGDETLTTHRAQQLAKKGQDEDAIAAAFMLEEYLENRKFDQLA